jgi:putative flippase GtrA
MTIVELQPTTHSTPDGPARPPTLDLVVPVHDACELEASIRGLHRYLSMSFPLAWRVTIVDAASTAGVWPLACQLARELPRVRAMRVTDGGTGQATLSAWATSDAQVLGHLDPSTPFELSSLLPLVAPLLSAHSDLAVVTPPGGQPGKVLGEFLAIRRDRLGMVLDTLDNRPLDSALLGTQLLATARARRLRVHHVPLSPPGRSRSRRASRRGPRRARGRQLGRQVVVFAAIGALSTLAYLALFVVLRGSLGSFYANAFALAATAMANTAANRKFTFRVSEPAGRVQHQVQGLLVFVLALAITTAALALVHAADASPGRLAEVAALLVANLLATVLRFVLLRQWVFSAGCRPVDI